MDDLKLIKIIKEKLVEELLNEKEFDYEIDNQTDLLSLIHFYNGFIENSEKSLGKLLSKIISQEFNREIGNPIE